MNISDSYKNLKRKRNDDLDEYNYKLNYKEFNYCIFYLFFLKKVYFFEHIYQ